jgi:hypothetical protein
MYISSVGAFCTFCTLPEDAPCFRGALGGTGVVFCGGVDGAWEAMVVYMVLYVLVVLYAVCCMYLF